MSYREFHLFAASPDNHRDRFDKRCHLEIRFELRAILVVLRNWILRTRLNNKHVA